RETPQQQYLEALSRGNGPEASQIWLNMTPEQKQAFRNGQGMHPMQSKEEIEQQVLRKAQEQGEDEESETPSVSDGGGSLLDLPRYINSALTPAAPSSDQNDQ